MKRSSSRSVNMYRLSIVVVILLALFVGAKYYVMNTMVPEVSIPAITNQVFVEPATILPGDPVFITADFESPVTGILWNSKKVSIFSYENKVRAFVPIDLNEKNWKHVVTVTLKNGQVIKKDVVITPRKKIEMPLGIPEKLGGNTPAAANTLVSNLAEENRILNSVKTSPTILWTKSFNYPVANVFVTDDYGYSRNTVSQTITHKGTDFRAQVGTPVKAMNRGVVRIARLFTVYGNTVVIDHGLGVQSLYMHMSKLNVKEGDMVEQGQLIGLSGDTGYAEAPHLHISVKIGAVSIDPVTFLIFFTK